MTKSNSEIWDEYKGTLKRVSVANVLLSAVLSAVIALYMSKLSS